MKKYSILTLLITFWVVTLSSCDREEVESNKSKLELISQNNWKLDRFSTEEGELLQNSDLNQTAVLLFVMDFQFQSNGEVRGVSGTTIVDRGTWEFVNNETAVNVKLSTLDYEFQVLELKPAKLVLQAPTGNFLSGVGERVNLEFSASN